MRRFFMIICVVALLVPFGRGARAQSPTQTPAAAVTPWNGLVPSRTPSTFQTIANDPQAQFVAGSDTASSFGANFTLHLPFGINFLGVSHAAGDTVHVGIGGYLSFNHAATASIGNYLLQPDPIYNTMLFPFWSDLRTRGQWGQGIHHLARIDPLTLDSLWTIEWSVETIAPPIGSGRFQLVVVKHPASSTTTSAWTEFLFNYDPTSELNRSVPSSMGAQIGAKGMGQPVGPPTSPSKVGDDDSYYLLMTPPESFPLMPAITRLPTRQVNGNSYTPDWYATATLPSFPSPYFHNTPPDSGFRMKPVETDADVKLGAPPFGTRGGICINPGGTVTLPFSVGNNGHTTIINAPVRVDVYSGTLHLDSAFTVVDTLPPHRTVEVSPMVDSLAPGSYRAVAIVSATGDQNPKNDTATYTFYVRPNRDIMPVAIASPPLGVQTTPRIQAGDVIPISIMVGGVGTSKAAEIYYSYTVRDAGGLPVASMADSSGTMIPDPDSTLRIELGSWMPVTPGRYYLEVTASAREDQIGANDTLKSIPNALQFSRGSATTAAIPPRPVPIMVYAANDPAAGRPGFHPFAPVPGSTITDTTAVMATFVNNGATDLTSVTGHVIITAPGGGTVYNSTATIAEIPGGGGTRTAIFPAFMPGTDGTYKASAWLSHSVIDPQSGNDSVEWSFTATIPGGGGGKIAVGGNASGSVEISPNPATDAITLRWSGSAPGPIRSVITDLLGAPVRTIDWEPHGPSGSATVDLSDCPSGIYLLRSESRTGARTIAPLVIRR